MRHGQTTYQRATAIGLEQRAAGVVELALQHQPAAQIAEQFGISRQTVDRDLRETLERIAEERHALGDLVYDDHLRLLDTMIMALRNKALSPDMSSVTDLEALKELRATLDNRAKLLNLYPVSQQTNTAPIVNNYIMTFAGGGNAPSLSPSVGEYVDGHAERVDIDDPATDETSTAAGDSENREQDSA